jgi:subtilisin family serine protease
VTAESATDRIIVRFSQPTVLASSVGTVKERLADQVYSVTVSPGSDTARTIAALKAMKSVVYAEPDYRVQILKTPNDPSYPALWGMNNTGGDGAKTDADIDAPEAWDISVGTGKTLVAVIDTGVDYRHPDLARNMWRNPGEVARNGKDDDNNGVVDDVFGADFADQDGDPMDENGHGTHVAGTIGAIGGNGIGVAGVNWNARIMAVRFLDANGSGYLSDAIQALDYAVRMGATLSNNSWGGGKYSQALKDAISKAGAAGHLFVAAAGNNAGDNDRAPSYPASYDNLNILSVASTTKTDGLSGFSNYGKTSVDIAAPGSGILSTLPGGRYGVFSGTSMATPHVTGALSLIMDARPGMSGVDAMKQLMTAADKIAELKDQIVSGGRLNVASALALKQAPSAPIDLVAGTITYDKVTLSWRDTASNEESFRIYSSNNGQSWAVVGTAGANQTAFTLSGLRERTSYRFKVTAVSQDGESESSNVITVTTAAAGAMPPANLKASSIERTSFRLSWTRPKGDVDRFEVWVHDGQKWNRSENVSGDRSNAVIEYERSGGQRLRAGRTYQVKMRAINEAGRISEWSDVISIKMGR